MTQQQQPLMLCQDGGGGVVAGSAGSTSICGKDFRERTLRSLKLSLGKLWKRRSVTITEYDPTYKVAYLGNVLTGWAKGEGCVEKPLSTLWKNYTGSSKPDVQMKVTVTQAGLKAVTKEHGLTEYWSHRITYCAAPASFPRIFCWVYRHEGRKLKQELRCHAVLCSKEAVARRMASQLKAKLAQSLSEFKRDKVCRQNARLSLANSVYENPSLPRRKILLSTGSHNYRPPLERSKSAPKLMVIEESIEEGEEEYTDEPRDHVNRLYKDASVLIRLEEVPGEEKYQDHPKGAENMTQRCNDNNDEREQSDCLTSRGTLRTVRHHDNSDEREQSDCLTSRGTLRTVRHHDNSDEREQSDNPTSRGTLRTVRHHDNSDEREQSDNPTSRGTLRTVRHHDNSDEREQSDNPTSRGTMRTVRHHDNSDEREQSDNPTSRGTLRTVRHHDNSDEREQSDNPTSRGTLRTLRRHDNSDEREQSDNPTSRGTMKERGVVEKEVNDMSFDKCSRLTSVTMGDNESGNLEGNSLSVYRFEKNQEHVSDRETASSHGLPRFRGSGYEFKRNVVSNLETRSTSEDGDSWRRNISNYHTERLLVIGSCKDGDVRRCIPISGGVNQEGIRNSQREFESDEGSNSLQSISSSASCSSDNSSRVSSDLTPLVSYIYEDSEIQTTEDEVEVDLHPTGESAASNLDQLSAQLRRSATFPPPSALVYANGGEVSELDSLSEEDDAMETPGQHEEEEESDESGYVELMDSGVKESGESTLSSDRKETDLVHHQMMKIILRGDSRSSHCLQV